MSQTPALNVKVRRPPWWLVASFMLALLLTVLFASRVLRHVRSGAAPEDIRPWMSIPHIARAHHVPVAPLNEAIGLPPDAFERRPLVEIAREQGRPVGELMAELKVAIARINRPPLPPAPSDSPPPPQRDRAP
jgi:hypothetical protein